MEKRTTVRDLRRTNRSSVLTRLFLDGPLSRLELGRLTGLSGGTVSNVTAELISDGLVVEAGLVESEGGRPRVLLRVDPRFGYVVGVDVGETRVKLELLDLSMRRLSTVDRPLGSSRPDPRAVADHIAAGLREAVSAAQVPQERVLGVGVGVFGTVEEVPSAAVRRPEPGGTEVLVHAPTVGWDAVPLARLIRAGTGLPLFIDNGAKTLGQAVVTHGATYRGASSSAGEWGHTTIAYGGRRCRCGARGCLEAYVGAEGVLD